MLSRKRYVGAVPHLRGKTDQVMVQFEEWHLQEARGWWQFAATEFD
jgi:hypothetical protein